MAYLILLWYSILHWKCYVDDFKLEDISGKWNNEQKKFFLTGKMISGMYIFFLLNLLNTGNQINAIFDRQWRIRKNRTIRLIKNSRQMISKHLRIFIYLLKKKSFFFLKEIPCVSVHLKVSWLRNVFLVVSLIFPINQQKKSTLLLSMVPQVSLPQVDLFLFIF